MCVKTLAISPKSYPQFMGENVAMNIINRRDRILNKNNAICL